MFSSFANIPSLGVETKSFISNFSIQIKPNKKIIPNIIKSSFVLFFCSFLWPIKKLPTLLCNYDDTYATSKKCLLGLALETRVSPRVNFILGNAAPLVGSHVTSVDNLQIHINSSIEITR